MSLRPAHCAEIAADKDKIGFDPDLARYAELEGRGALYVIAVRKSGRLKHLDGGAASAPPQRAIRPIGCLLAPIGLPQGSSRIPARRGKRALFETFSGEYLASWNFATCLPCCACEGNPLMLRVG